MSGRPKLYCLMFVALIINGCGIYELATLPSKLFPAAGTVKAPSEDAFFNMVQELEKKCYENEGEWTEHGCYYEAEERLPDHKIEYSY